MRHFLSTEDWSRNELQGLLDRAAAFKSGVKSRSLEGKSVALVFFNPSLRTRSSFDIGAHQLGGHAIVLDAKGATWPMEFGDGAIMDGAEEEHVLVEVREPEPGQEKGAKFPTSKAPISAVFHSFRLIFGRAIISRNGLEAWMLFPERARAEHSR